MSIVQQQGILESFSDQMLSQEAMRPSGQYPQFLVVAEMERRRDLRHRYQAQNAEANLGRPSVVEQRASELSGIPSVDTMAGQQMAGGGIVGYAHGGDIDGYANGGQVGPDPEKRGWLGFKPWDPQVGIAALKATWDRMVGGYDPYEENEHKSYWEARGKSDPEKGLIETLATPGSMGPYAHRNSEHSVLELLGETFRSPQDRRYERLGLGPYAPRTREELESVANSTNPFLTGFDEWGASLTDGLPPYVPPAPQDSQDPIVEETDQEAVAQGEPVGPSSAPVVEDVISPEEEALEALVAEAFSIPDVDIPKSEIERELEASRMTPEQRQREKMALALSGIGALIGGATNMGDIPKGLGDVTREVIGLDKQQRAEDLQIMGQLAGMEEKRLELEREEQKRQEIAEMLGGTSDAWAIASSTPLTQTKMLETLRQNADATERLRSTNARNDYLAANHPNMDPNLRKSLASDKGAFDAFRDQYNSDRNYQIQSKLQEIRSADDTTARMLFLDIQDALTSPDDYGDLPSREDVFSTYGMNDAVWRELRNKVFGYAGISPPAPGEEPQFTDENRVIAIELLESDPTFQNLTPAQRAAAIQEIMQIGR